MKKVLIGYAFKSVKFTFCFTGINSSKNKVKHSIVSNLSSTEFDENSSIMIKTVGIRNYDA